MLANVVSAAIVGAALVSATPFDSYSSPSSYNNNNGGFGGNGHNGGNGGNNGGNSGNNKPSGPQQPFKFPLSNGFPNIAPGSSAVNAVQIAAHGTLPNTALPKTLSATSKTDFSVIAEQEIFEVAYFTSLINNITNNVPGYEIPGSARDVVLRALTTVQAQEQLHAIGANGILTSAGAPAIQPCQYVFPVSNFDDAIKLTYTFTDVVLGTLQDVQNDLIADGDSELVPLLGSIIGNEAEQNGFYRSLEGQIPSGLPFLTRSAGLFAWSALNQNFIVPGSCPNAPPVPILPVLKVVTPAPIQAKDQSLTFSFVNDKNVDPSSLSLVYINQQNSPIVEKLKNVKTNGKTVTFQADFPYSANLLNSLTISALTTSAGPFAGADDVAKAAVFGPGLIEVN